MRWATARIPLRAMITAALTNVALDLLFTVALGWGIAGMAIATLIAQVVSMVYCLIVSLRLSEVRLERRHFAPDREIIAHLSRLGAPVCSGKHHHIGRRPVRAIRRERLRPHIHRGLYRNK